MYLNNIGPMNMLPILNIYILYIIQYIYNVFLNAVPDTLIKCIVKVWDIFRSIMAHISNGYYRIVRNT